MCDVSNACVSLLFRRVRKNYEKRLLVASCLSVLPSVRMEQLGPHWMDFHLIWNLNIGAWGEARLLAYRNCVAQTDLIG